MLSVNTRSKALDVLRAVAIVLVLGSHLHVTSGHSTCLGIIASLWRRGGWVGVDLFFVLSGFLISGLLFSEHKAMGGISFKHFLIRRGFKIYPSFYIMMIVTFLFISRKQIIPTSSLIPWFSFIQNYIQPDATQLAPYCMFLTQPKELFMKCIIF